MRAMINFLIMLKSLFSQKSNLLRTDGTPSLRASISSLWGSKQLESLVELNLDIRVVPEKIVMKRRKAAAVHNSDETNEDDNENAEEP